MASDLDPNCPEMREQRRALRGLDRVSVSRKYIACELSERFGGTVESWQAKLSKAYMGKTRLSLGAYRAIEQSLDEQDRLEFARAAHVDLDLTIDTATYDEPDDLGGAAMDALDDTVNAYRATMTASDEEAALLHERLADNHRAIAAAHRRAVAQAAA